MIQEEDLVYLAKNLAHLSGIPVRLYQGSERKGFFCVVDLPVDPMLPWEKDILSVEEHVSAFTTSDFDSYGIISYQDWHLVAGPSRETMRSDSELRKLAFTLAVPDVDLDAFLLGMKHIVPMPPLSLLEALCSLSFALYPDEKLTLNDVAIHEEQQTAFTRELTGEELKSREFDGFWDENGDYRTPQHNTISIENTIMDIITRGDLPGLMELRKTLPAARPGVVAGDPLRQIKNILVVTATLASRAAIRGGMLPDDALRLSDAYIYKSEQLLSIDRVSNLITHMVEDYTERVWRITAGQEVSPLVKSVSNYILHHLSDAIRTEEIADALYLSRGHLSTTFKEETGVNLSDFIHQKKTEEACRLLRYTDRSFADISTYLGYSSQSHFSRVFKKFAGCTPNEYRKKG